MSFIKTIKITKLVIILKPGTQNSGVAPRDVNGPLGKPGNEPQSVAFGPRWRKHRGSKPSTIITRLIIYNGLVIFREQNCV